ncbi:MAG TPA: DUF47 family protein [Candidatus Eisenbergiella merdipullorum]|uniref:DUF47 family protein n=1 Tax=Candidatus Eisenbergiella merdipullorum TaxID=2838553 RepID=A0A9D2I6G2_9FIRM|nr:DUF47 family protein [Candidatus Eisenbergiella merdipullorum]
MSKKQDSIYFNSFITCTDYSCQAAHMLEETMADFNVEKMEERMSAIHTIEHSADMEKHALLNTLSKAFITPIDREDIMLMSQNIDELTDKIEDVLIRIYYNNIQSIRPDALELMKIVCRCCEAVKKMMEEFADFRHSKLLHEQIIQINSMEEEADKAYINSMHSLHTTCSDPMTVMTWREIYSYLEKCADACEHVADIVESVVMKNT